MALIQKIRSKSWLVLGTMILAIIAFIGMLITQDSNRSWGSFSNTTTVAKAAGQALDVTDMERQMDALNFGQSADLNFRNSYVEFFINNALMSKQTEAMGLGVSIDELRDLMFGANPSRLVLSSPAVMNRQTGQADPEALVKIKEAIQTNQLNPTFRAYWAELEKQVMIDRTTEKMMTALTKGIYTPTWLVDEGYRELTEPIDFRYVKVPFERVDDKDAPVTDADFETYLKENKARFINEDELRAIEYITFDVVPTAEDSAKLREKILSLKENFRTTDKDSAFAVANGGVFSGLYQKKEELNESIRDSVFSLPLGSVVGPFIEGKFYGLAKIIDRRASPDSVKSRHILIDGADAQKTADSLLAIIKANPSQWDSINVKYSADASAKAKNGDLGYQAQGMFVAPFNDLIFYKAAQGEYRTVATQFGVHIVQVTGIKAGTNATRAKLAYVREGIIPSAETDKKAAAAADELLSSAKTWADIKTAAQAKNLSILPSPGFKSSEVSLGAFGRSDGVRQIIRWAYEASIGERAKTTFALREEGEGYNSRYVIAGLKSITPKGLPAVKDIKEQLTPFVKNKKKGEVLKSKITAQDLNTIAGQFNAKIDTAKGVTFNANFVPNLGAEPRVLGTAFTTEIGQTSKAIVGESGVFVLSVDAKNPVANSPVDKNALRQQLITPVVNTLRGTLVRALRKNASISDNRMKFF